MHCGALEDTLHRANVEHAAVGPSAQASRIGHVGGCARARARAAVGHQVRLRRRISLRETRQLPTSVWALGRTMRPAPFHTRERVHFPHSAFRVPWDRPRAKGNSGFAAGLRGVGDTSPALSRDGPERSTRQGAKIAHQTSTPQCH